VGFQTRDLMEAMWADAGRGEGVLRVDGGMSASDYTMQFVADITGAPVDRPKVLETTALGAAWLAGQAVGFYAGAEGFAATWAVDTRFAPKMDEATRGARYERWRDAVSRTLSR
jgi:glycerol kinase